MLACRRAGPGGGGGGTGTGCRRRNAFCLHAGEQYSCRRAGGKSPLQAGRAGAGGGGVRLAGAVEVSAAVVDGDGFDEAEPVPPVDGGAGDPEDGGELPAGDQFLAAVEEGPPGGGDPGGGWPLLPGWVEEAVPVLADGVDQAEFMPSDDRGGVHAEMRGELAG